MVSPVITESLTYCPLRLAVFSLKGDLEVPCVRKSLLQQCTLLSHRMAEILRWSQHLKSNVHTLGNRGRNVCSPRHTGTHFPLLKKRECNSLVKQISEAAGVLWRGWVCRYTQEKAKQGIWTSTTAICLLSVHHSAAVLFTQTHHLILLKFHNCRNFSTPTTRQ